MASELVNRYVMRKKLGKNVELLFDGELPIPLEAPEWTVVFFMDSRNGQLRMSTFDEYLEDI